MPHIILETTSNIAENQDISEILENLVAKLCTFETVVPHAVKAYHSLRSNWAMGEGGKPGFVHLEVSVLTGRNPELLAAIADGMYAELKANFPISIEHDDASFTCEIREMNALTYRK